MKWLGFRWNGEPRYASGYFDQLYAWAIQLIEQGDAYVDLQSPEEIKLNRGSFVEPGKIRHIVMLLLKKTLLVLKNAQW